MMSLRRWFALGCASCCLLAAPSPTFAADITERVSVSSGEGQANDYSQVPSVSANGSCVAYASHATNLVTGDTNEARDVLVRDRSLGTTERVSVSSDELEADGDSDSPSISADGRFVAFRSSASNLVPVDTNFTYDIFVRDRLVGTTERVSVNSDEGEANSSCCRPSISADGRYVAFVSGASDLVSGDTNGAADVFVRDRLFGITYLVSVNSDEVQTNDNSCWASISGDGRFVAFESDATNLIAVDNNWTDDVFVRDRLLGTTECASVSSDEVLGNSFSRYPRSSAISADGRFVTFYSLASNLVPADYNSALDVFVRDRETGTTSRVSVSTAGTEGNSHSQCSSISADGRCVAFPSEASNLASGDSNMDADIFLRAPAPVSVPEVLLEVHPNERAPGAGTNQYIGQSPWTQPTSSPAGSYWWKKYEFAAHGPLWIQVCAQNWDKTQKGYGDHDDTQLQFPLLGPLVPVDYDGIQSGAPGNWQWAGGAESGKRTTLRFLVPCPPGKQVLWLGADESPVLWWLKVTDLEPDVIEAF